MNKAEIRGALETAITIAAGALDNQSAIHQMREALAALDDDGLTLRLVVEWHQEQLDYHDNQAAGAEAMGCPGPLKFHDRASQIHLDCLHALQSLPFPPEETS